jgi:GntR family transcriptional regulator
VNMAKIPAYRNVYIELKRSIIEGNYKPGMFLPTESELEKSFNTSRTTIRKAIEILVSGGYVSVRQGRGTEVLDISTIQRLNQITSFTETLVRKGHTVTTQGMYEDTIPATLQIANAFSIELGSVVHRLQRVQCADGQPIAIMENYAVKDIFSGLSKNSGNLMSLYDSLEKNGVVLKDATEYITAIGATFYESQILKVPIGEPLLMSSRITNTEQGPFEYSIVKVVAAKYEYCVHLSGRA